MSTVLIVLLLLILAVVAASLVLGRGTYEVDSARDTEFLELDGSWVRYDVMGGGPPVVLVHGWLSSSRVWEDLARRLAQRFTVYSLDLTGFGESDKPPAGYGVRNGSRLLYAFCAHFGLTRASVVGHDLGGNMAVKLAADHPDVVGRVVLVSAPADEDQIDLPTPLWLATLPVVGPLFYALGRSARPVRRAWMRPFVAHPDDLTDDLVDAAASSTPAAVAQTLSSSRREISGGRLVRQAKIIKTPMLVVSGEEDRIVDPQSVTAWAGGVERAEICLLGGCGHVPMIERPAEFTAQILAFLTGDARYLDQIERPTATDEAEEANDPRPDDSPVPPEDGVAPEPPGSRDRGPANGSPAGHDTAGDDTADLTAEYPIEQAPPGGPNGPPKVHRKRDGAYPAEDPEAPEDRPRRRNRRAAAADDQAIPELPADLFDWPAPRRQPSSRRRNRPKPPDDPGDGRPENRNGPSRT